MAKIYGILSLVFSIISLPLQMVNLQPMQTPILGMLILTLILSIVGIIFGGLGVSKDDSKATAKAGLLFGIIGILFPIWWLINIFIY